MLPDRESWSREFVDEKFMHNLSLYLDKIIKTRKECATRASFSSHYNIDFEINNNENSFDITPREGRLLSENRINLDSFYYVDYIVKNTSGEIYDIGCGSNIFKHFFKGVIGLDPNNPNADMQQKFNDKFIQTNQKMLPSAFAINSLHYIPITEFKNQLCAFASCIRTNGLGYITFNIERMLSNTDKNDIPENLHEYIESEILSCGLKIINYDLIDVTLNGNDGLDGNIRILFKV